MNKGCCVPEVRFCFRGNISMECSGLWQGVGCCHSSSFITDTTSVRLLSRRVGVRKVPEKGSVAFWKEGPSVVHWGMMKSVHLLDFGRVWSLGYPFSQQNILTSHCCLWEVSATEVLIRDSHLRHRPLSPSYSCPSHEFRFHYTPLPSFHAPNTYISFLKCLQSSLTFLHSPLLNLKLGFQDIFKYFFFLNNLLWFETQRKLQFSMSK